MSKMPVSSSPVKAKWNPVLKTCVLLAAVLCALFYRSFDPNWVAFSNDGPLGQIAAQQNRMPFTLTGSWRDLNSIGSNSGSATPDISSAILFAWEYFFKGFLGPRGFSNSYVPIGLFILGLGAWTFFRQLKLSPLAATLGALATMLNTAFFAGACWGIAAGEIAIGFNFLALALIIANDGETSWRIRRIRIALAGLCVGVNVMEAADVGALCSLFIALFIFFKAVVVETNASTPVKVARGIGRIAVVAVFAGFIAAQTIVSLVETQIKGVAGTAQDEQTKAAHWDFATQWSLPKKETLGIFVPGLFGYRMDTPQNMMPFLQDDYQGGVYWGGMGRTPELDRYFDAGSQGTEPSGPGVIMRFGYGGYYCGILVALLAFWTIAQSFRKKNSPFSDEQKKFIWFWTAIIIICLLLAWGRFAPMFYGLLYQLPYFSTIRNPAKFLTFAEWAFAVLFAYGVHGLSQRSLRAAVPAKNTARNWDVFDRKWTYTFGGVLAACVVAWLIYASEKNSLIHHLEARGFPNNDFAAQIASFSIGQVEWFLALFAIALILLALTFKGRFSGHRARLGGILLGAFLIFDLGRADVPFVIHWNYKQKYEVGMLNPIVDFLRKEPYEHRVAQLPFRTPPGYEIFSQLYGIEWSQQLFPYYNIQSLDIIQMPRMPSDLLAYKTTFAPNGSADSVYRIARRWELTNTRYLLGPAGFLDVMNKQLDPVQHRFRIVDRFNVVPKPGVQVPAGISPEQYVRYIQPEKQTAQISSNGQYALFDFTGALPRAKLYTNWQTNSTADLKNFTTNGLSAEDLYVLGETDTNDFLTLKKLAAPAFDPEKTVLLDAPLPQANPSSATNENAGTVEFKSYAPKKIVLSATAVAPSVLLLNDKYDPNWHVTLDGKPAPLLRANFIMRGVFVPAGQHTVEFQFSLPNKPLYVTLSAIGVGIILIGLLIFFRHRAKQIQTTSNSGK